MKKLITLSMLTLTILVSCTPSSYLKVSPLNNLPKDEQSTFTLMFLLGSTRHDPKCAIVIDLNKDEYEFVPRTDELNYEILHGISLHEAFLEASLFFNTMGTKDFTMGVLLAPGGAVAGYEFRPIYIGKEDPVKLDYPLDKKDTSKINIIISGR